MPGWQQAATSTTPRVGEWGRHRRVAPWSHIVLANFKRWLLDIFHGVSPAHLQAYLDEFCYRLNRRGERLDLFRRVPQPLPAVHRAGDVFAANRP